VARARAGDQTLVISTDPAPSLGDALRQPLVSSPRVVTGTRGRLHAVEVDAAAALDRWLSPRRAAFEKIVLRGSWLDEEDVKRLLNQSLPGIDEIAALMEIGRFARATRYDAVIIDTAPTGHTLRMLAMPRLLETIAGVFDEMQHKHRALVSALRGSWTPEEPDLRISELSSESQYLSSLLRHSQDTAVSWVTLPEPMALAETVDGLDELRRLAIHVDTLVINRLTPPPDRACGWCAARRKLEHLAINPFLKRLPKTLRVTTVVTRAQEPRGPDALLGIAGEMDRRARCSPVRANATAAVMAKPALAGEPVAPPDSRVSLLMFGGKGGVGKTTCSAAAAIEAAAMNPQRSVLLLSTDPAHSLGDVLGTTLGNDPRPVVGAPSNLRARELDATAGFEAIKTRYRDAIDALFARFGGDSAISVAGDRQSLRDLVELAPPGLDELMAVVDVSDSFDAAGADLLLVVDTAPTGHALRLMEMPALVHEWVKALMSILLKYETVTPVGELGSLLVQMSQGLSRLRKLLVDPSRTAFIVVTRPAALPIAETERLIGRLRRLDIPIAAVLVNAIGAGTCSQCTVVQREQQRALAHARRSRRVAGCAWILAPAVLPPPTRPRPLRDWRRMWKSQQAGISSRAWVERPVRSRARALRKK
jgi:arsenite/tail-anchored protein-transporting ATPase